MKDNYNNPDFYIEKALDFLADGDFRQAISFFRVARSLTPENMEITSKIAEIYLDHNHPALALEEFLLLWQKTKDPDIACELAELYVSFQDYEQAQFFYYESLQLSPLNVKALSGLGNLLVQQKFLSEAIAILERLKQLSPKNKTALLHLANAYLQNSQVDKARENLKLAYRQEPSDLEVRLQLARLYFSEELYIQAIKLLLPLEEETGQLMEKLELLIDCHIGLNHYEEAHNLIERLESLTPDETLVIEKRLALYFRQREFSQIDFWYKKLLDKNYCLENILRYADYLHDQGFYEKQEVVLVSATEKLGNQQAFLWRLCNLYRSDRPLEALKYLDQLLLLEETEELILRKAELLMHLSQSSMAIQWLEQKRSQIKQQDVDEFLEKLLLEDKNYKAVIQLMRQARQAQQSGNWKKALHCFTQLLDIMPDNVDWLDQVGNLYAFDINYPQALQSFEKAAFYLQDQKKRSVQDKIFYLSWLYNDFEKSLSLMGNNHHFEGLELNQGQQKIKAYRHLLAEKWRPLSFFEDIILQHNKKLAHSSDPMQWLFNGFLYLLVGSHFLDTDLWSERATTSFRYILEKKEFSHFHNEAYEGLYLTELSSFSTTDILPVLKAWVQHGSSEKVMAIYLEELLRRNQPEEGVALIKNFLQRFPENMELRFRFFTFRLAVLKKEKRPNEDNVLQQDLQRLQKTCTENPHSFLAWFDLVFASLVYTAEFPNEKMARRILQMAKKAIKLANNRPDCLLQMMKVYDYAGYIDENERKLAYGKKKLFLEKLLLENGEVSLFLKELGILYIESGQELDLGYRCLMRALTLEPTETDCNIYLGDYFMACQNFRQAIHYYLKAMEEPISGRRFNTIADKMQRVLSY